jgi:hypothetical protein
MITFKSNSTNEIYFSLFLIIISTLIHNSVTAQITVDLKQQGKPLQPLWAHFGYDEAELYIHERRQKTVE